MVVECGQLFDSITKVEHSHTLGCCILPKYVPKRNVYVCLPKDRHKNVHSSTTGKGPKLEPLQETIKEEQINCDIIIQWVWCNEDK